MAGHAALFKADGLAAFDRQGTVGVGLVFAFFQHKPLAGQAAHGRQYPRVFDAPRAQQFDKFFPLGGVGFHGRWEVLGFGF